MSDAYLTADPEIYKDIEGFPGYKIGKNGKVLTRTLGTGSGQWRKKIPDGLWRVLEGQYHSNGYRQVLLFNDGKRCIRYVHRLVLEHFVGPCPKGMEACHENNDRTDNRLENLRWDTRKNNHADKVKHGTLLKGSGITNSKLKEDDIPEIMRLYRSGMFQREIAERYGVNQANISQIITGKTWAHVPR